jgi:hypothetical protein
LKKSTRSLTRVGANVQEHLSSHACEFARVKIVAYTRAGLLIPNHKERIAGKPKPKMKQNEKPIFISKVSELQTLEVSPLENNSTKDNAEDLWQQANQRVPRHRW